jgi:hypothetical protein
VPIVLGVIGDRIVTAEDHKPKTTRNLQPGGPSPGRNCLPGTDPIAGLGVEEVEFRGVDDQVD